MTKRPMARMILVFALFSRIEASTLILNLTVGPPVHSYSPEWTIQIPSSGATLTQPAVSVDQAANPNATGMIIPLNAVSVIEFNLLAPEGSFFHTSPSGVAYALSYSISLDGWDLPIDRGSGAAVRLVGVTGTPPPWFFDNISDDLGSAILHGFSEASTASYGFTGMRITMPVTTPPANGQAVLNSAEIRLSSRYLYGTVDPGQAMSLIPIPEGSSLFCVMISGLLLLRRNRPSP